MIDTATLERLVPDYINEMGTTGRETLRLHLERYAFAAKCIGSSGRILDLACGVGYGSRLLKDAIAHASVTGVDISSSAIEYAHQRYSAPGLTFIESGAMVYHAELFDAVVSLETIEHLQYPAAFIQHVSRNLLKPGGIFVGSVPVTPSMDANPHHLTDFTSKSFRRLLSSCWPNEIAALHQIQPFDAFAVATCSEVRMQGMRRNLLGYYAVHPMKALLRIHSTLRDGFNNKYLTLACK
jgi:SAM-dependent methyltransferase